MSFLSLNGPVHSPLFFLAGLALGLVFASATFSSSVWVVQATMAGGWTAAWRVVCGVSLAQGAWALMASFPLPGLRLLGERFDWPFRAVAAGAFLQLAFAVAGSPALAVLRLTDAERPGGYDGAGAGAALRAGAGAAWAERRAATRGDGAGERAG